MLKKMSLLFVLLAAIVLNGCFKSNENGDIEKGVVLKRNNNTVSVLAKNEIWGGSFIIDREIRTDEIITEADKMRIIKREDGKTVINIVDFDGGIKEGEKIFEIKECFGIVKVELTNSIKEDEFESEVKKELKRAVKKGIRASTADELLGDFNNDLKVDVQDFALFQNSYGSNISAYDIAPAEKGTTVPYTDVYSKRTADGVVDLLDFLIFAKNYGKNIVNIPTVTSVVLNGLAVVEEESSIAIYATVKYSDNTQKSEIVNWSSSDETVAQVTANGEWVSVKGVKAGSVEIKAEKAGKVGILPLTVTSKGVKSIVSLEISGGNSVATGSVIQLGATAEFEDKTTATATGVIWSSSNSAVATVDSTGKVTGVSAGTAKIKALKSGVSHEINIVVTAPVNGVKVHAKGYSKIYAWEGTSSALCGLWPGSNLVTTGEATGWGGWYFEGKTSVNVIFIDANGNKTADLKDITTGEYWYINGKWETVNPEIDLESPIITATPTAGNQEAASIDVVLTATDNKDALPKIYYTTDGTIPTINSAIFSGKITLSKDGTIKALASDSSGNLSKIYVFSYKLNQDATPPVITTTVAAGNYENAQIVKITATDNRDSSPIIYYTIDGTEPKAELLYMYNGQAINVDKNMVIKALAVDNAGNRSIISNSYFIGKQLSRDFREENVYFMMTDRFCDGDTNNNNIWGDEYMPGGIGDMYKYDESKTGILTYYHGGDFAGIIKNLDYLQEMGFTAIWITPVVKQPEGRYFYDGSSGGDPYQASAFHGYWGYDFDKIDPHLHSSGKTSDGWNDFKMLVNELHKRDMKLMLDIVANHGHPGSPSAPTKWLSVKDTVIMDGKTFSYSNDPYKDPTDKSKGFFNYLGGYDIPGLIDFNERGPAGFDAREHLKNVYKKFIDAGVDAFRIDTVAYMTDEWWGEFADAMYNYASSKGNNHFYMVGESWTGRGTAIQRHSKDTTKSFHMLDMQLSCMDYPGQMSAVFRDGGDYGLFGTVTASDAAQGLDAEEATWTGMFVDNHDVFRANGVFGEQQYKNALTYIYLFRGIPIVYYGTEAMYSWSGAYASTNKDDVVARWMLGQQGIDYVKNNKPSMYKHLKMLNKVRLASELIQKGIQENLEIKGDKAVFKRSYNGKTAYVAISKGAGYTYNFTGIPSGTYRKLMPGDGTFTEETVTVSGGSSSVTVPANGFIILEQK